MVQVRVQGFGVYIGDDKGFRDQGLGPRHSQSQLLGLARLGLRVWVSMFRAKESRLRRFRVRVSELQGFGFRM